jgi:hypothetical protein
MTWSFDPRHSPYDSAATLELWMIEEAKGRGETLTSARQQQHLVNVNRLKSEAYLQRNRCVDCGLVLAENCGKTRCVSCAALHRKERQQARRIINRKFVGHLPQTLPKPS